MERKNYLEEELTREEKGYLKKAVESARKLYLKKNLEYLKLTKIDLTENIIDEQDSVLDIVIKKSETEVNSAIGFEKEFSDPRLYNFIKALSYEEKMMLFSLYKENKSIRRVAKENKIDKNTVKRRKDKLMSIIEKILRGDANV